MRRTGMCCLLSILFSRSFRVKYCCNTCSWILYKFEFLAETKPRKPNANDNVSDISRILSPQAKLISRLSPETNRRNYDEPPATDVPRAYCRNPACKGDGNKIDEARRAFRNL